MMDDLEVNMDHNLQRVSACPTTTGGVTDILYLPFTVDPSSAHRLGATRRLTITPSAPNGCVLSPTSALDHATSCHTKQQNPALVPGTNGSMEQVAAVPLRSLHAAAWRLTGDSTSESLWALVRPLSPENWRSRRTTLRSTRKWCLGWIFYRNIPPSMSAETQSWY